MLEIDRPTRDDIVLILVIVLAYSAGCGGSGMDVNPNVRVNARVVVSPPPILPRDHLPPLPSSPLPSPHHMPLTNFLIVVSMGSGTDVDPEVGVDACVVVLLPPSSLVTVVLLSSPLPIPH